MLGEVFHAHGPERVEPDVERDALDVQPAEQLGREVEARRRSGGRAGLVGVDGLVALRVDERLRDVRRQRRLPAGLAVEPDEPAARAEVLDELDGAVAAPGAQPPRGSRERLPETVADLLEQQHLTARPLEPDARGEHAGVVDDNEGPRRHFIRKFEELAVPDGPGRPLVDEQPGRVAALRRMLRDELPGELVVELGDTHSSDGESSLAAVDETAIERAKERLERAAEGRAEPAELEAALERAREQIESLAQAAAELESSLPERVGSAVREGVRSEAAPVARQLAEVRGLMNQVIRRLERVEGDLLAERHARVDDLGLLVDLITSSWKSVDRRLSTIERKLVTGEGAIVYRMEERRTG